MRCLDYTDPLAYAQLTAADWARIEGEAADLLQRLLDYPTVMVLPVDLVFDIKVLLDRLEQRRAEKATALSG